LKKRPNFCFLAMQIAAATASPMTTEERWPAAPSSVSPSGFAVRRRPGYDTSSGCEDFGNTLAADGVPGFTARSRHGNAQVWARAD
jgi:hypothetical protein